MEEPRATAHVLLYGRSSFSFKNMSFIYTRAMLKAGINRHIQNKIGMLVSSEDTVNEAVRTAFSEVDLRSSKRTSQLTPDLFNGIFDYACPTDLKAQSIIDIPAQAKRADGEFFLVPTTEFATKKAPGMISFKDFNGVRALQVASQVDSKTYIISELDSEDSGGGTWVAFGDAVFLGTDTSDYIKGNASLVFDISAAGGTTAGIMNTSITSLDISDYLGGTSSIFVWARITSTTNLTNYKLRFGNDASNYYTQTVTTQSDGTALVNGWNLLRFPLTSYVETGTVDETNLTYFAIYMTKTSGKISETDYKFDWLTLKKGVIHNVYYYSKYGWQSSSGTYKENSTDDSDVLVADTDEFEVLVKNGVKVATRELDFPKETKDEKDTDYSNAVKNYLLKNPSEAIVMTSEYYKY